MREYSEVVIGAFLHNFKVKDIAAAAGLSVSTINKYKREAIPENEAAFYEGVTSVPFDVLQKCLNEG